MIEFLIFLLAVLGTLFVIGFGIGMYMCLNMLWRLMRDY